MSTTLPTGDRPIPAVAIIGNDAVLAAAPATPVQLAHACLRRGFAVAVPASWGDELVAAEVVRRLAVRERGPAVMCVCPYVRARLLAPGPDLAPFLVSLVAPPVAAARYVRAAYGEHGVHITYIGGCPGADDPTIDVRLTPDAFFADLAERGIALSEQPLVFDSIVPPDRRRWCSLPGGVPSAEGLWNETDARTLVEIDRDDVSTDLAQHIMMREHVLLDLAPSLGCSCSGAVPSLLPRSARSAVTALEPPRALGPVVDSAAVVSLDVPVGAPATCAHATPGAAATALTAEVARKSHTAPASFHDVRDDEIGRASITVDSSVDVVIATRPIEPVDEPVDETIADRPAIEPVVESASDRVVVDSETRLSESGPGEEVVGTTDSRNEGSRPRVERPDEPAVESPGWPSEAATPETHAPPAPWHDVESGPVRRRTPPSLPVRHSAASIPRTSASDGRSLPRAYVARRRTPSSVPAVAETGSGTPPSMPGPMPEAISPSTPPGHVTSPVANATASALASARSEASTEAPHAAPKPPPTGPGAASAPSSSTSPATGQPPAADAASRGGSMAAPAGNHGALGILLVSALVALCAFVLATLRR